MPSPSSRASTAERAPSAIYRLDDLLVDTGRLVVTRAGSEIPLPPLSFDLLRALVEAAPNVVTLDELMGRVWAGVVVSPETVSQRVKLLREALGDDARQPRYVAGVRGRGYRVAQPVVRADALEADDRVSDASAAPMREELWKRWPRRAAWVAMLLAVLTGAWLWSARVAERAGPGAAPGTTAVATPERSVAVLPFENLGAATASADLALGVPEAVLHQLARLPGLHVTARSSSFAFRGQDVDARELGRQLGVRYLLEGSVQTSAQRLRVTASLVDAAAGTSLWSVRFDRRLHDVFAIQDEIAMRVAQALEATLDAEARLASDPRRSGTSDQQAYMTFLRGRALLDSLRVADLPAAVAAFDAAIRQDPNFAAAYVQLARARVAAAEQLPAGERQQRFRAELDAAMRLLDEAIELAPRDGEAFVERGYLRLYFDVAGADADLRRGLELAPSSARGYEGLAAVLFQSAARRREALEMIERARSFDPLEPRLAVVEATYLLYGPAEVGKAEQRLQSALERDPLYVPALVRLGELYWCCQGRLAEAVWVLEQAVGLDPGNVSARRNLADAYVSLGEVEAGAELARGAAGDPPAQELLLLLERRDWIAAGELAYSMLEAGEVTPLDERRVALAIRRHAHATRDHARAIEALGAWRGVEWDGETPLLEDQLGLGIAAAGLAELLSASGQAARAEALATALLEDLDAQQTDFGRGAIWLDNGRAIAMAVLHRDEEAIAALGRRLRSGALLHEFRQVVIDEPAFDRIRASRGLVEIQAEVEKRLDEQRGEISRMRQQGLVPKRAAPG
jgi:TolB-like protein/DNA-binding winged helix-turn-helix (wHTH) protein/Tfp pilus assembly protein PilF